MLSLFNFLCAYCITCAIILVRNLQYASQWLQKPFQAFIFGNKTSCNASLYTGSGSFRFWSANWSPPDRMQHVRFGGAQPSSAILTQFYEAAYIVRVVAMDFYFMLAKRNYLPVVALYLVGTHCLHSEFFAWVFQLLGSFVVIYVRQNCSTVHPILSWVKFIELIQFGNI